jgi:hypothetical protein
VVAAPAGAWAELRRLAARARAAWIAFAGGGDPDRRAEVRESLDRATDLFRRPGAGPLERLLAARAGLAAARAEYLRARWSDGDPGVDTRALERARREHRAAIRVLRTVQELLG